MSSNAVVTPHHLSAEAGRHVLSAGGNAVDAAVAVVAAQGVVAPETCGVGGDLFALVHAPGWPRPKTLNASGRAGSNADPEALREAGLGDIAGDHPAAVTIPGCVDGLVTLISGLGSLELGEVLQPAIDLAHGGFEVSTEQHLAFTRRAGTYAGTRRSPVSIPMARRCSAAPRSREKPWREHSRRSWPTAATASTRAPQVRTSQTRSETSSRWRIWRHLRPSG